MLRGAGDGDVFAGFGGEFTFAEGETLEIEFALAGAEGVTLGFGVGVRVGVGVGVFKFALLTAFKFELTLVLRLMSVGKMSALKSVLEAKFPIVLFVLTTEFVFVMTVLFSRFRNAYQTPPKTANTAKVPNIVSKMTSAAFDFFAVFLCGATCTTIGVGSACT